MSWIVIRETVRRNLTNVYFVISVLVATALSLLYTYTNAQPSTGIAVLATFLAVQVIGPEISSGSLQLVMARPIGRVSYLLSRFAGVCLVAMVLVWVVVLATLLFGTVIGQDIAIVDQLLREVAASLKMIFFMALIVLFGCMSRSHTSVLLVIIYAAAVAGIMEAARNRFPAVRDLLRRNLVPADLSPYVPLDYLIVISNILVILLLAAWIFCRRQLPYGAD